MEYVSALNDAEIEIVVHKSRFICACRRVETEEQALAFLDERRRAHPTARHAVYAYVLRCGNITRFSDDGEPQGTSGRPTLGVILARGLTDTALVTTRYFGGVLLGKGGLVAAYTDAASRAIDAAGQAKFAMCREYALECSYAQFDALKRAVELGGGTLGDVGFTDKVTFDFNIRVEHADEVLEKLNELSAATAMLTAGAEGFLQIK